MLVLALLLLLLLSVESPEDLESENALLELLPENSSYNSQRWESESSIECGVVEHAVEQQQ